MSEPFDLRDDWNEAFVNKIMELTTLSRASALIYAESEDMAYDAGMDPVDAVLKEVLLWDGYEDLGETFGD